MFPGQANETGHGNGLHPGLTFSKSRLIPRQYGTGHTRLNDETDKAEQVGGINYTIKDGIVYDAKQLLADVRQMVVDAKAAEAGTGQ